MAQSFQALQAKLNSQIWPNGVPENLTSQVAAMYQSAMVTVYRHNECLKQTNVSVYPQCSTYFKCATTIIAERPKGVVKRVYTLRSSDGNSDCFVVALRSVDMAELQSWSTGLVATYVNEPDNVGLPALPLGYRYPEQSTDSAFGRSICGVWAIDQSRLVVAPWLQSDESLVVEWEGKKTLWIDDDSVLDDPQFEGAVKCYVQMAYEQDFGCDRQKLELRRAAFAEANSDLLWECREELRQQPDEPINPAEARVRNQRWCSIDNHYPSVAAESAPTVFAFVSDYGDGGSDSHNVAVLVKSWKPEFILTGGDNNYSTGSAADIDNNIGSQYRSFIYPYAGSQPLWAGEMAATKNKFWPVPGNHDLDTVVGGIAGAPYFDYFTLPKTNASTESDYDFIHGPVHFFMMNSAINTAGVLTDALGNDELSVRQAILAQRVALSTAKWKVLVFHHPPYTSGSAYTPGKTQLRWDYKSLGIDLVLNGHSHNYERLVVAGLPYIVCGSGGHGLTGFGTPLAGSEVRNSSSFGALRLTATCSSLKSEFIGLGNSVLDTVTFTK